MIDEDIDVYLDSSNGGSSYLESLVRSFRLLIATENDFNKHVSPLILLLEEVIETELHVALLGAEKAKSEILKATSNKVVPLKGA